MTTAVRVLGMATALGLAGCAGNGVPNDSGGSGERATADAQLPATASAVVLGKEALDRERGRPLLDAIRMGLPGVRVWMDGPCPTVAMRAPAGLAKAEAPTVYVDGAPASDTCILEDITSDDVARVEVYPSGFTARPGYRSNASGLILVFTRHGRDDRGALVGFLG